MIDETLQEQAALYACDQLTGDELAAFEKELGGSEPLRELVGDLREAAAGLALSARAPDLPSPELRERVLASAGLKRKSKVKPGKVLAFFTRPPVAWGLAAAAAIVCGVSLISFKTARTAQATANAEVATANAEIKSLLQQIEAERILGSQQLAEYKQASDVAALKIARLTALTGNSPEAVAIAIWNPLSQEGVLAVDNLPGLQRDQDYQLWIVDPQYPDPVNGGAFSVDASGDARVRFRPDQPVSGATQFAISRERKGGVSKAQGPIVAAGAL